MKNIVTQMRRISYQRAMIALTIILASIAVFLWSAPYRAERFYRTAALDALQAAAKREPENVRLFFVLGQRLLAAGRPKEARDALEKAAANDSESAEIWIAWATASDAAGDAAKAHSILATFAKSHSDDKTIRPAQARLCETQGKAALHDGQMGEAFSLLRRSVELDPDHAEAQFQLAGIYYRMRFADEAVRRLKKATELAPTNSVYWNSLGLAVQNKMEKFGDAEDALQRAVTFEPKNAVYLRDLANIQAKRKNPRDAEANYRKALAAVPKNYTTQFWLARLLVENDPTPARLNEAEDLLEKVAAADSSHAGAMFDLGRLALLQKRPAAAVRWLEAAVALSPRNAYPYFQLSRAYHQIGDTKRAAATQNKFDQISQQERDRTNIELQVVQSKDNPALRLKLARLLVQSGENAKAINQYRVFLAHDPKNAAVRRELFILEAHLRASGDYPDMALFDALATPKQE